MGFTLTYSDDGTVEASLNLKGSGAAAAPPPPTQPLRPPDEEELAPLSPSLGGPAKPVTEGSKVALPASTSKSNSALR